MITAVIFDMDGLMIDSEPFWQQAEIDEFKKVGIQLNKTLCQQTMGLRIDEVVSHWYSKHPWDINQVSMETIKQNIISGVISQITEWGKPMVGLPELMAFVAAKNVKTALASSSDQVIIDAVLVVLNVSDYFQVVHSAEKEKYGKPHPAVFLSAAEQLNVSPLQCLVLEDSVNGVIAAKAARMKCIAVPEHSALADKRFAIADKILSSLSDFDENTWQYLSNL